MEYGEVLREFLSEKNMTAGQLAKALDCNRQSIYSLIDGRAKEPTLGRAKAICDALGVTLQEFADRMDGK